MINNKKVVAIIEARMGSKRLPGKVLLPLNRKPVLEQLINRITFSKLIDEIVVATTHKIQDKKITDFCKSKGYRFYCGSENDVLGRVYETAFKSQAEYIVSITGDCPCIDYAQINTLLNMIKLNKLIDCTTNYGERSWPDGLDLAICTMKALKKAYKIILCPSDREHSLWNIAKDYENHDINAFIVWHYAPPQEMFWPELRITLDTQSDYELLTKIFEHFGNKYFSAEDIINYIRINSKKLKIYNHLNEKI